MSSGDDERVKRLLANDSNINSTPFEGVSQQLNVLILKR